MPLYEYRCLECDRTIEVIQKFSDPELTSCSHCKGRLEKVLSAPAIQFKGSGWYITDYARKNGSNGASAPSSSSDSSSNTTEKTTSKKQESASTAKSSE